MLIEETVGDEAPPGYATRWRTLGAFLIALVLSQTYWFNFAPLLPLVSAKYGVTEMTASYTILVFSLSNILLSGFAGTVIDKHGFRFSVLLGLAVMSVFACLRILDSSFWVLLVAQTGISAAVPFIMVAIPKAVATLFPAKDWPRVSGFCSIGICLGSSSSLWLSPRIILGMGFHPSMIFFASLSVVWTIAFALLVPAVKVLKTQAEQETRRLDWASIVDLFRIRSLVVLFSIGFVGHGVFTCVTTWMGALWHERGFSSQAAGMGSSMLIIGGIFGCLLVPHLLSRFRSYRLLLWTAFVPCIFLVTPFLWAPAPGIGLVWGWLMGFFYLSMMPTIYSMFGRYAPAHRLGLATGLNLMIGSIGGIVVTVCFRLLKDATGWHAATVALIAALALISALVVLIPDASPLLVPEVEFVVDL
jgi:MFS transporter, FLVCR family, feline leukemia virus subgroup C receptor-related protein